MCYFCLDFQGDSQIFKWINSIYIFMALDTLVIIKVIRPTFCKYSWLVFPVVIFFFFTSLLDMDRKTRIEELTRTVAMQTANISG